jgi:hypothetical protein
MSNIGNIILTVGDYSNANVADYLPLYSGDAAFANITAGTLFEPIQNNITEVGTLTGLTVNFDIVSNAQIITTADITTTAGNVNVPGGSVFADDRVVANVLVFSGGNVDAVDSINATNANIANTVETTNIYADNYYWANGEPFINTTGDYSNANVAAFLPGYNGPILSNALTLSSSGVKLGGNSGIGSGPLSIAIGERSGGSNGGDQLVAIGAGAGSLGAGSNSVSIGTSAGYENAGNFSVNIGYAAGETDGVLSGANSISIGTYAGRENRGDNSIAIGALAGYSGQANNSIVINASGTQLNTPQAGLFIDPVRADTSNTANVLLYDVVTKEITFGAGGGGGTGDYSNANVEAYLPFYTGDLLGVGNVNSTGNITANVNITAVGNITGSYLFGNGAFLTGIDSSYGNANVAEFLPTYNGNLANLGGNVVTTANVTASNLITSGNVFTGNIVGANNVVALNYIGNTVTTDGNITASYFIGNGSELTNLAAGNVIDGGFISSDANGRLQQSGYTVQDNAITNSNLWSSNQTSSYVLQTLLNVPNLPPVTLATTTNSTRSGLAAIDGVTPVAGNYILVKNQTNGDNGVFMAQSGAWIRQIYNGSSYANVTTETTYAELGINNGIVNVLQGTVGRNLQFQITEQNPQAIFGGAFVFVTATTKIPPASINNRFVDNTTGNDTNNNGSSAFPFATITRALTGASFPLTISLGASGLTETSPITWTSGRQNSVVQSWNWANDGGQTALGGVQTFGPGSTRNDFKGTSHVTGASAPFVFQSGAAMRNFFEDLIINTTAASWISFDPNISNWITFNNINIVNFRPLLLPAFVNPFVIYVQDQVMIMPINGTGSPNTVISIQNCMENTVRVGPEFTGIITWNGAGFNSKIGSVADTAGLITSQAELDTVLSWITDTTYDGYYYITGFTPTSFREGTVFGKQTLGGVVTQTWWARTPEECPSELSMLNGTSYVVGDLIAKGVIQGNIIAATSLSVANSFTGGSISVSGAISGNTVSATNWVRANSITAFQDLNATVATIGNLQVNNNAVVVGNLQVDSNVAITGNITVGNILTDGYYYANGEPFAGGGNGGGNSISFGNTSIEIPDSNGDIQFTINDVPYGNLTPTSVFLGANAGLIESSGNFKVAVGYGAGSNSQGAFSVAVGSLAGTELQKPFAVAVGQNAGYENQGTGAVAIGSQSGLNNQGEAAIAIGLQAGLVNQPNNSIILNASGEILNSNFANSFTVAPIRANTANITNGLYYNSNTGEITIGQIGLVSNGTTSITIPTPNKNIIFNIDNVGNILNLAVNTVSNLATADLKGRYIAHGNANIGTGAGWFGHFVNDTASQFYPNSTINSTVINVNSYSQVQHRNQTTGSRSTSDYVATADTGSDTTNYIDMGIAGSAYNNTTPLNSLGTSIAPLDGYLYTQGGNLVIGTNAANRSLRFIAGGGDTQNIVGRLAPNVVSFGLANASIANTVVLNASGNTLNVSANSTYISSVRPQGANVAIGNAVYYNSTTREITTAVIPRFSATASTTTVITAQYGPVTVIYNTVQFDAEAWYDRNTGRYQPQRAGYYQINASARLFVPGTTQTFERYIILRKNGTQINQAGGFGPTNQSISQVVFFNGTTDYVDAAVISQSTGNIGQLANGSVFSGIWMAPQ